MRLKIEKNECDEENNLNRLWALIVCYDELLLFNKKIQTKQRWKKYVFF